MRDIVASVTAATALLMGSGSAAAADIATAKLGSPAPQKAKVVAGGSVFTCEANDCISGSPSDRAVSLEACKVLAKRFGKIISLSDGRRTLAAEKLETCNTSASGR